MGHNQTAHLLSFGNSLIRVHSVSFHMIKCNWINYMQQMLKQTTVSGLNIKMIQHNKFESVEKKFSLII